MGALTMVGQRFGAKEYRRAGKTASLFTTLVGCLVLFLSAVIYLRARYFVIIFTTDPDVIDLCVKVLRIVAFVQIPKAMS